MCGSRRRPRRALRVWSRDKEGEDACGWGRGTPHPSASQTPSSRGRRRLNVGPGAGERPLRFEQSAQTQETCARYLFRIRARARFLRGLIMAGFTTTRRKKPAPFRFRLCREGESCISAGSFLLDQTRPASLGSRLRTGGEQEACSIPLPPVSGGRKLHIRNKESREQVGRANKAPARTRCSFLLLPIEPAALGFDGRTGRALRQYRRRGEHGGRVVHQHKGL